MMFMSSFLLFQGSRPGLFYDLSAGESCPLRIPPINRGLRFPPLISRENDSGLRLGRARRGPPVTSEKTTCPSRYYKLFDALISKVVPKITNFFVCFT